MYQKIHTGSFICLFLLTSLSFISSPLALVAGFSFSFLFGNPLPELTSKTGKILLKTSVVGLGFGVNFHEVIAIGKSSLLLTLISISAILVLGEVLGILLKIPANTRRLVCFGTAICGGSAIAAMAPVIKAKEEEIAVSLATVFTLNALSLLIFPPLGHLFGLGQQQFGLWAALAIHDTSSVVGASAAFGALALTVGTTTKLTRALWIAPCSLAASVFLKSGERAGVPLFIVGFIAAAFTNSWFPALNQLWDGIYLVARQALVMTLFLIGAGLTRKVLQQVGFKPFLLGSILWIIVSTVTLTLIINGTIH